MFAYIGRQAIYNQDFVIAGYELLYRNSGTGNVAFILDGDAATRSVLSDAINVFGLNNLTEGLPAYINFTRNLLLDDFAFLAKPRDIVVEIPGNITVDEALINKLQELKALGYQLSLDEYSQTNGILRFDTISHMFDVIRLNVHNANRLQLRNLMEKLRRSRARLLADRIETEQEFDLARSLEFSLFQGYYFEKPVRLSKQVPLGDTPLGRLTRELLRPEIDLEQCSRIIQSDALLTYLFLQQVPGARRARNRSAEDINTGIMSMGPEILRRWASLILLKQGNVTRSDELPLQAYARGRFIERLMENADTSAQPGQGFFVGLISLLDQVMGIQLADLVTDLNMGSAQKAALLGKGENEYSLFLQYAVIYEMHNDRLILPTIHLRVDARMVGDFYQACVSEAEKNMESLSNGGMIGGIQAYQGTLIR